MSYIYTQENRLKIPHRYMYSTFEEGKFLTSYYSDRNSMLNSLRRLNMDIYEVEERTSFQQEVLRLAAGLNIGSISSVPDLACASKNDSSYIERDEEIDTSELLYRLLLCQIAKENGEEQDVWLDRLIQRFEVTKKLYERYCQKLRKGKGACDQLILYWLLGLTLCSYYIETGRVRYLSTQLKISDLLCSIPLNELVAEIPGDGLTLLLSTEVDCLRSLVKSKSLPHDS